jgi:hypothetical protein
MESLVRRPITEPIRSGLTWDEKWLAPDKGLVTCWEVGRKRSEIEPELAEQAKRDELPPLGWKGGVEKRTKQKVRYGTLNYLAEWQGLRGEDLNVDLAKEIELVCSRTGMKVIFTSDVSKYGNE